MPSLSPAARSVSVRGDLKGPPKTKGGTATATSARFNNNKELTQLRQETRIWTPGKPLPVILF